MSFEHASVFWSSRTGAHAVFSPLLEEYVKLGGPTSQLGYPLADSQTTADAAARFSRFEHGDLYFDGRFTDLGI